MRMLKRITGIFSTVALAASIAVFAATPAQAETTYWTFRAAYGADEASGCLTGGMITGTQAGTYMRSCIDSDYQRWDWSTNYADGWNYLVNKKTGLCLTVNEPGGPSPAPVFLRSCVEGSNYQRWTYDYGEQYLANMPGIFLTTTPDGDAVYGVGTIIAGIWSGSHT